MNAIKTLVLVCCIVWLSVTLGTSTATAQKSDPFGAVGDAAIGDPFSGGGKAKGQAAPFDERPASSDPFAGTPPARRSPKQALTGNQAPTKASAKRVLAKGRQPVALVAMGKNSAEPRIHSALGDETSQTFVETPLGEAVQALSATHEIPIIVDRRALEEIGLSIDAPVTIDLKNVSLRSFLRLMLRELDLTYLVKDQVLQITTVESAETNLVIEMYVLPPKFADKADQLIKVIETAVVPDTWASLGGNSTMSSFDHLLIVSSTTDTQDRIKSFLERMIEKYGD